MKEIKKYLGDGVYAQFDGLRIILTTEDGLSDDPGNKIILEPEVYTALVNFELKEESILHYTEEWDN